MLEARSTGGALSRVRHILDQIAHDGAASIMILGNRYT